MLRFKKAYGAAAVSLLGVAVVVSLAGAPATAAPVPAPNSSTSSVTGVNPGAARAAGNGFDPLGFWTPEKMAAATPADEVVDSTSVRSSAAAVPKEPKTKPRTVSKPVGPTVEDGAIRAKVAVPTTVGRIFYTGPDNKPYSCSGATVNSAAKNLIHTAAHCVYTNPGGWNRNIVFVPAYFQGSSPFGVWNYKLARTFNAWIQDKDWQHDQAFVSFYPSNGAQLVNTVGGNGLQVGLSPRTGNVRIWGYPAQKPYDGSLPYYCDGDTTVYHLGPDAQLPCGMNGGASGGPWFSSWPNPDYGYVYAVTSRRTTVGPAALITTPDGTDVLNMYGEMG